MENRSFSFGPHGLCVLFFFGLKNLDPYILAPVKIDRGAIRFVLAGAQIMCPGLTSKGGELPPAEGALAAGTSVAVFAEGKEHAVAVGFTKLSSEEIKKANKGVGVETTTYLGDDLWNLKTL
jgi:PUA domain protein